MTFEIPTSTPLRRVPADYAAAEARRWLTLREGPDAGRTIFYLDHRTGTGPPEQTVVLVHGNPECSYTFRHIVRELCRSGRSLRIVAMDHLGFGLSDQAGFEMVDMHHAANLGELIRRWTCARSPWSSTTGVGRSGSARCWTNRTGSPRSLS